MAVGERDVVVDVTIKSDTRGAKQAAAALDDVSRAADRTGDHSKTMARDMALVDAEVRKTTTNIEHLERQMLLTGDRSLQRTIASERRWLASVRRVVGVDFTRDNPFTEFGNTVKTLPRLLSGSGIIGGLTALAALGPLLGGGIAGIVSGAVGTGGIAGGLLMAANEPKVQAAAKAFGSSIAQEFFSGGQAFVQPAIDALTILEDAFKDADLGAIFAQMAPLVTTVASAFAMFGTKLAPGLDKAFSRMDDFAAAFHEGFTQSGAALGKFLDEVTASPGAVMGLDAAFKILNLTIVGTGKLLRYLSDAYAGALLTGEFLTGLLEDVPLIGPTFDMMNDLINDAAHGAEDAGHAIHGLRPAADSANYGFHVFAETLAETNAGLRALQDSVSGMIHDQLSFDQALLEVQKGWAAITEAVIENGTALKGNSEQALANREMFLDRIADFAHMREEWIGLTGDVDGANDVFQSQIDKLVELGVHAGFARGTLEELAKNYYVNIVFQAELARSLRDLAHLLPGYGSNVTSFASGGTTPASEVFRVGENGPELMFSSKQHYVANKAMMMSGGDMGTGGTSAVSTSVTFAGDIDAAFSAAFMKLVRNGQITIASRAVVN